MTGREIHAIYAAEARRLGVPEDKIIAWEDLTASQRDAYYNDALNLALQSNEGSDDYR